MRAVVLSLLLLAPVDASAGTRRALLIGIQSYSETGSGWEDLRGPLNDVALIRSVLTGRHGFAEENVTTLLDREATAKAIREAFDLLVEETGEGDIVYVHYSGHGSRVKDANGDEPADPKKDSTLVPIDARDDGAYEILDDEIRAWVHALREKASHVTMVVDACHSGTITRSAEYLQGAGVPTLAARGLPPEREDTRDYAWSKSLSPTLTEIDGADLPENFVRLSACHDHQRAYEYVAEDGGIYGLFSWHLAAALSEAEPGETYMDVFGHAEAMTRVRKGDLQAPVYEGPDAMLLFGEPIATPPSRRIEVTGVSGDRIVFRGGFLNGVTVGSLYEAKALVPRSAPTVGSMDTLHLDANGVTIETVEAFSCTATLPEHAAPKIGDSYSLLRRKFPFPIVKTRIVTGAGAQAQDAEILEASLRGVLDVEIVDGDAVPELVVHLTDEDLFESGADRELACYLLDASGEPYAAGSLRRDLLRTPATNKYWASVVACKIKGILENRALLSYAERLSEAPSETPVEPGRLRAKRPGDRPEDAYDESLTWVRLVPGPLRFFADDTVAFRVENKLSRDVFAYVINIGSCGSVTCLFPPDGGDARIRAGSTPRAIGGAELRGEAGARDTYLCYVLPSPGTLGGLKKRCIEERCEHGTRGVGREALEATAWATCHVFVLDVLPEKRPRELKP